MSDISSVAAGLAQLCSSLLYPNGTDAASFSGRRTIIQRGWLTEAVMSGICGPQGRTDYVLVMPVQGAYRTIPEPLGWPWETGPITAPTVSLSIAGNTATVSIAAGSVPFGNVGLQVRADANAPFPDRLAAVHAVQSSDTPATIAAALAAFFPGATVQGPTLTIPHAVGLTPATGGTGTATRITRRQQQLFLVTLWSASPEGRDALGSALDGALSGVTWFAASDGAQCQLKFAGSADIDTMQAQSLYRRDMRFNVIYDTTQNQAAAQMLFGAGVVHVQTPDGPVIQTFGSVIPDSLQ